MGVGMKERPILFSTEMVRALLDGRKTMTRRLVKPQPSKDDYTLWTQNGGDKKDNGKHRWGKVLNNLLEADKEMFSCPYGQIGDILWVRETWADLRGMGFSIDDFPRLVAYKADSKDEGLEIAKEYGIKWKPSIFMPRSASRISLRITNIRVERLNDITEEDAIREGVEKNIEPGQESKWEPDYGYKDYTAKDLDGFPCFTAIDSFKSLWGSINGENSWAENPWVWVIEFEVIA